MLNCNEKMGKKTNENETCQGNTVDNISLLNVRNSLLDVEKITRLSETFKALSDPTRLNIIYILSENSLCVCDIAQVLDMTQSAISHHLRILRNLELVKFRKEGKMVIYSLDDDHVLQLFRQGLDHVKHQ